MHRLIRNPMPSMGMHTVMLEYGSSRKDYILPRVVCIPHRMLALFVCHEQSPYSNTGAQAQSEDDR